MNGNLNQYNSILQAASSSKGVDCTFAKAIMSVEDQKGDPKVYSNYTLKDGTVGHAYGLMELTQATYAANGGTGDISDPTNNINAGVTFIKKLMTTGCNGSASQGDRNTSNSPVRGRGPATAARETTLRRATARGRPNGSVR